MNLSHGIAVAVTLQNVLSRHLGLSFFLSLPTHTFNVSILPEHDQVLGMVHTKCERCHCRTAFAWEDRAGDDTLKVVEVVASLLTSTFVT